MADSETSNVPEVTEIDEQPENVPVSKQTTKSDSKEDDNVKLNGDVNGLSAEAEADKASSPQIQSIPEETEPMEVDDEPEVISSDTKNQNDGDNSSSKTKNESEERATTDSTTPQNNNEKPDLSDPLGGAETAVQSSSTPISMDADSSLELENEKVASRQNGTHNKDANGAEEIHSIDSDSDEEDDKSDCMPMEVDSGRVSNGVVAIDEPVSIESDSDSGSESTSQQSAPKNNGNEVHEILSDKEEDCVVIEDKTDGPSSSTPRQGTITVRRFDGFEPNDDSLEEDPLGATNPISNSSASSSPVSFAQKNSREPPGLVMVDANSLMKNKPALPAAVPAQGTYPLRSATSATANAAAVATIQQQQQKANANLLPALSDDMFVLEAPSFIVPYIYEKPPVAPLKEVVEKIGKVVEEERKKQEKEKPDEDKVTEKEQKEEVQRMLVEEAEKEKIREKKRKSKRKQTEDDDWDEMDTSDEDESDGEGAKTKVLIKDLENDISLIKEHIITPESIREAIIGGGSKKPDDFFQSPLGKFFMGIGVNLVQEHVQKDLLRQQKRKRDKEGVNPSASTQIAINSLMKNLETSKENNAPFKFELKRCEYCNFKSESALAMAHHYETPHMRNGLNRCNFCEYEAKPINEILYHIEALHNIKGRVEKPLSYHQCPNCLFEDNGKSKLARHALACVKKFKPESNLAPPLDWEPPAKIPKIKPKHGLVGTATAYQMAAQQQQAQLLAQQQKAAAAAAAAQQRNAAIAAAMRNQRGRPNTVTNKTPGGTVLRGQGTSGPQQIMQRMMSGVYQNNAMSGMQYLQQATSIRKPGTQPSISITPVPRQSTSHQAFNPASVAATTKIPAGVAPGMKPGQNPNSTSKTSFVICEICDGYIKDLDQLRNHMQWIHKVKIHPKMIYNRPPLNCQKCQYRFFTDQGLERHLLGSHGLVTSSMQDAANKGKDAGRCPVCGRVYQWKLLNHVSRDHNMTLKPAHLSYKCTVCTATFGMYKQFESHVYSAHSSVAKKAMDKNKPGGQGSSSMAGSSSRQGDSLLKPLKINDEITIIPQPASKPTIANTRPIEIE